MLRQVIRDSRNNACHGTTSGRAPMTGAAQERHRTARSGWKFPVLLAFPPRTHVNGRQGTFGVGLPIRKGSPLMPRTTGERAPRSRLAAVGGQARAASPAQPDTPTVVQATDTKRGVHTGSTSGAPCAVRRAPGNLVVTSDVALPRRPPGCPGTAGGGYGLPTITISIEVSVHGVRARSSANLSSAVDGCHRLLAWSCSRASTSRVRTASTPDRPAPRRR